MRRKDALDHEDGVGQQKDFPLRGKQAQRTDVTPVLRLDLEESSAVAKLLQGLTLVSRGGSEGNPDDLHGKSIHGRNRVNDLKIEV